ncbi:DHS-like NAD/FAD-binding domain-containing protein [Coniochaeta sp. 2T2.1]|nr:DHS-like NAD/FAD-binding domain-containing protein [Coniochaeta sp. 2T2.1]
MCGPSQNLSSLPSSSPLSVLSKSPSPPPSQSRRRKMDVSSRYPSPSSSAAPSGSASPMKSDTTEEICGRTDGPPPAKRRKLIVRKERTTEYVDMENPTSESDAELDRLLRVLRKKKKIVVIAGAGISVSSGIPDFRSSTGLFKTLPSEHKIKGSGKDLFDASVYKHNDSTSSFHDMIRRMSEQISQAKPSPFHHLLASIAQEGRLLRLYTQNIDCIDTNMPPLKTKVPLDNQGGWPKSIQLHGGLNKMVCSKCGEIKAFDASLFNGPEPPLCPQCLTMEEVRINHANRRSHGVGKLRPRIVLYNEHNPDQDAIGSVSGADLKKGPDAVIVVGTTLKIPGVRRLVKELCQVTRSKRDGFTAWINLESEPQGPDLKDCWDLVVKGRCDDVAQLTNLPRYDEQDIGDPTSYSLTEEQHAERVRNGPSLEVEIERKRLTVTPEAEATGLRTPSKAKSKTVEQVQDRGIPTPSASPRVGSPAPYKTAAAKTKQSKLVFGGAAPKEAAPAPAKKAPAKRSRKAVKNQPQPKANALMGAFKATKSVAMVGKKDDTDDKDGFKNEVDDNSSDRSLKESIYFNGLPSLRPPQKGCTEFRHTVAKD